MHPHSVRRSLESGRLATRVSEAFRARGEDRPGPLRVSYVRYKPGGGSLFGLQDAAGNPAGYLKTFRDGGSAACHRKYGPLAAGDGWLARFEEEDAVLFRFPADRRVRALPFVADWPRLKHILHGIVPGLGPESVRIRGRKSTAHLIKYKPERRAIFRVDLALRDMRSGKDSRRSVVVQVDGSDSRAHVPDCMNHLRFAANGLRVPEALAADPERRILVQEWVDGRDFASALTQPEGISACAAAGRALRAVHGTTPLPGLPDRSARSVDERCRRVLEDLASIGATALTRTLEEVRAVLDTPDPEPGPTLVHGDFYYHQILLPPDPERSPCAVLDWDEAGIGDPRQDVACFLAHLHLRELEGTLPATATRPLATAFLEGYGSPEPSAAVARQLVLLAMTPFRNLRPTWEIETALLLARAARCAAVTGEAAS